MQVGVIMSSDLTTANRWDASFHLLNQEYRDQAATLAMTHSKEAALALLSNPALPLEALRCLEPLVRGRTEKVSRDQLLRAIDEYPFLALAIVQDKSAVLLEQHQAALTAQLEQLEASKNALKAAGPKIKGVAKLPNNVRSKLAKNNFVKGVVYFDGTELSIPADTSPKAYVADCWVIELDDWTGPEMIDKLVAEGNVPVPRRTEDLGNPVGFLDSLADHTRNYGRGWC